MPFHIYKIFTQFNLNLWNKQRNTLLASYVRMFLRRTNKKKAATNWQLPVTHTNIHTCNILIDLTLTDVWIASYVRLVDDKLQMFDAIKKTHQYRFNKLKQNEWKLVCLRSQKHWFYLWFSKFGQKFLQKKGLYEFWCCCCCLYECKARHDACEIGYLLCLKLIIKYKC